MGEGGGRTPPGATKGLDCGVAPAAGLGGKFCIGECIPGGGPGGGNGGRPGAPDGPGGKRAAEDAISFGKINPQIDERRLVYRCIRATPWIRRDEAQVLTCDCS